MRSMVTVLLFAILAVGGCGGEEIVTDGPPPLPEPPDASVVLANCAALQQVVERFAEENDGIYPDNVDADTSIAGNTVLDLLPVDGFENPFAKEDEMPVNGVADSPGEIGYAPVVESGLNVGYVITGFGIESLVATLSNLRSPEEAKVIANCFLVRQTAEDQFEPDIGYPYERIRHPYYRLWLPQPLIDPYTGLVYGELVPRAASAKGEIGYVAIERDGIVTGYVVTGFGDDSIVCALSNFAFSREEALIAAECRRLQLAAENYADTHGSLFPESPAAPPGVTYEPIRLNGWNVGYRIAGSAQGSEFIEIGTSPEEARVRLNCLLLKQAVEESAAQNGGVYPESVDARRILGGSVIDLLPRAHLLHNPYTGMREVPVNHSAVRRGEIGYAALPLYDAGNGKTVGPGYVITGRIRSSRVITVTNLDVDPIAAIVMSHCRTLQIAVEAFAARSEGMYPSDVYCDATPCGETVIDLLPDGCFLVNPVEWCATVPINGAACNLGEIGYVPIYRDGYNLGYTIMGTGLEAGVTIFAITKEPRQ